MKPYIFIINTHISQLLSNTQAHAFFKPAAYFIYRMKSSNDNVTENSRWVSISDW